MSIQTEVNLPRLLVVDDDADITDYIMTVADENGFSVSCVREFELIFAAIEEFDPDVIFLDLHFKRHDGIEVLHFLAERKSKAKIVLISGLDKSILDSASQIGKQQKLDVIGSLIKPFMIEDIEEKLMLALDTGSRFTSDELQAVLGGGEFILLYQPIMSVKTDGKSLISAVEVRPYWETGEGHSLSLSHSISKLQVSGLLRTFSYSLLKTMFETYREWMINGLNIGIYLDISELDFTDDALLNHLNSTTENLAIPRNQITVGINHATIKQNIDSMRDMLTRLRINGFRVSVETMDTQIEEFDRMLHLPLDELRVSDALVHQIGSNMEAEFNVSTFISIANKKGLAACAAGVDSNATLSFLSNCKCDLALGSYIGKELKAKQVEALIRA